MKRFLIAAALFATLTSMPMLAQEADEPAVSNDEQLIAPSTMGAKSSPLELIGAATPFNAISGGFEFQQVYTDNALLTPDDRKSDISFRVQPSVSFSRNTPRLMFDVGGAAGFLFNRSLTSRSPLRTPTSMRS